LPGQAVLTGGDSRYKDCAAECVGYVGSDCYVVEVAIKAGWKI